MDSLDIDPNFEPQTRARSNTWPLPRPDNYQDKDDEKLMVPATILEQQSPTESNQAPKKNSSRRNAWGNMSYADLITQAIQSSPEKRLTLSQIYDWMVQNVPYFKDKGDSNSSAGWKNSIRHNLSLHNRFMRVQNEGTGKSSWWMINPDAKPGKAARRRAGSMETAKYEKKRGRVKKKVEALRNGLDATPSPSSSVSEGLDMFPESPVHHSFQLSPDFRPRSSSNASTCSRLSPIPAVESDMHDSQVPPLSPIPWTSELPSYPGSNGGLDSFNTDQLVDTLAERMKLGENGFLAELKSSPTGQLSPALSSSSYRMSGSPYYRGNGEYRYQSPTTESGPTLTPLGTPVQSHSPLLDQPGNGAYLSPQHSVSPAYGAAPIHDYTSSGQHDIFRTEGGATYGSATSLMWPLLSSCPLPNDLDVNTLQGGLDCDVDQVIKHELTLDPNLDFNFEPLNSVNGSTANVPHPTTKTTVVSRPWVH